jgi:heavy metal translocating P-type ATPase
MWCPACAWLIDNALEKTAGIHQSNCNFSTDRLHVSYDPVRISPDRIIADIARLGYRAEAPQGNGQSISQAKDFIRFGICAFLTMNVMMLSFAIYSGFLIALSPDNIAKIAWPMMVMSAVVIGYGGYDFFRKSLAGLFHLAASMETLIIVGSSCAFILSLFNQFAGSLHLYYDTACMLITLVLLGKTLEGRAKRRVLEDLESFFALMPKKVRICTAAHPEGRYVNIDYLGEGDRFRIETGEIVPADGFILSGESTVDESAITGEAHPVSMAAGDTIRSGVRLLSGSLDVSARQVGSRSTLGQMITIIEKSLLAKTPIEGKTDVILRWFVPVVLALAALTAVVCRLAGMPSTDAVLRAVTVTVISCPCALGIAIPLARVAGVSIAGRKGLLVRDFQAFEQAEVIDTVVFDKTGTITSGRWRLLDIIPLGDFSREQALAMAAGLEQDSEHFIATEIKRQADERAVRPAAVKAVKATDSGLSGDYEGRTLKIGSAAFLAENIKGAPPKLHRSAGEEHGQHSMVYLGCDDDPVAVFVFGDSIRPGAEEMIADLRNRGIQLALVSGDGQRATAAVGKAIGVETALGDQLPTDKANFVRKLQADGHRTAMVGDGINDSPALAQADLAIAIHSGGALAKEAADISFMRGEPDQLPVFLDFARRVNRKIHQNLIFTFIYNVLAIPIAISGLLNPLVAVTAMLLSSISVTGNTLMLVKRSE